MFPGFLSMHLCLTLGLKDELIRFWKSWVRGQDDYSLVLAALIDVKKLATNNWLEEVDVEPKL